MSTVTPEIARSTRQSFPSEAVQYLQDLFGQTVINIDVTRITEKPVLIEMSILGVREESFELFQIIIPKTAVRIGEDDKLVSLPLELLSFVVSPEFNVTQIEPTPEARRKQMGPEMIFFGRKIFSEVNFTMISRPRELFKTIYTLVALAILIGVISAWMFGIFEQNKD